MTILATDILDQLDQATHDAEFPVFDNGYVSFAAARLSGYRSEEAWGIVIEVLGYYYLERQFEDRLYVLGVVFHTLALGSSLGHLRQLESHCLSTKTP